MIPVRRALLLAGVATMTGIATAQPAVRRVLYLSGGGLAKPLAQALATLGWREGSTLRLETRVVDHFLPAAEADIVAREVVAARPDAIVAFLRDRVGAVARATRSIPIVGALHDPVLEGFAQSLGRPGANVTGLALSSPDSVKMSFRLLGDVMPGLRRIHSLGSREFHEMATVRSVRAELAAERGFVFEPHVVETIADAVRALESVRSRSEEAVAIAEVRGFDHRDFAARVLRARVALLDTTGRMESASLLSAGLRHLDVWGRLAAIVDKVLRGADPALIPFEQPTHAEVVLNRGTATVLGITFPAAVLTRATKIIE